MTKKLLIAAGAVIALVIVVVIALPFLISADSYKGEILSRVRDATGRELKIAGPLSLSIFPNIAIEAGDASLANAAGAEAPDMLRVKKLNLALKLMPLISGRVEIDHFVLVDPTIELEIDAQGHPNWDFGPAASGGAPDDNVAAGMAALSRLQIADLKIENGTVRFSDRRSGQKQELQQVNVTMALPSLDLPFTMSGSAIWHSEKITATTKLDAPRAVLGSGGTSDVTTTVESKPATLTMKGKVTGGAKAPTFDGDADLKVPSVRDFATWAGVNLIKTEHGFGPLAITGKLHATPKEARFTEANFSFDAIKAKGEIDADNSGAVPAIRGKLDADMLDLNPYLAPVKRSGGSVWNEEVIDTAPLKWFDADLQLSGAGMRYRQLKIGKSVLGIQVKSGKANVDIQEMAFYDGRGRGKIAVDANTAPPTVNLDVSLSSVQVGSLQHDLGGAESLRGAATIEFSGSGRGASQRDLVAALGGRGTFRIANATVGGVDFNGMLKNTATAFKGGSGTAISSASGSFTLAKGVMRNTDLVLKTDAVNASGAGTVNLISKAVDYRVTPEILAGLVTVPVIVSGTWDNLSYQPDVAGIAKNVLQTPQRALGGAADVGTGVAKGVGGALDSLFK